MALPLIPIAIRGAALLRGSSGSNTRYALAFSDVEPMIRILGQIDPEHVKALRANAREIAKPVEDAIRRGIPAAPPISGMTPKVVPGRLTWNTGFPANSTTIQTPRLAKKKQYNSIARVRTRSSALGIADMAGRSRRAMNRYEFTRDYPYSKSPTGMRRHRITATGSRKFIENLDSGRGVKKGSASRFVWPSAEKALPFARYKMENVLNKYAVIVNARLRG
jgi:hypothetical protein